MRLATLTSSGRAAIAKAISLLPIHCAWGTGVATWDTDTSGVHWAELLVGKTALENEIGRRVANTVAFAAPDDSGDIVIPVSVDADGNVLETERYTVSLEPTPFLFVETRFDYEEAKDEIIREVGIFIGTEVNSELPAGQQYFTLDQLSDLGRLLAIQRPNPFVERNEATREKFQFILPI